MARAKAWVEPHVLVKLGFKLLVLMCVGHATTLIVVGFSAKSKRLTVIPKVVSLWIYALNYREPIEGRIFIVDVVFVIGLPGAGKSTLIRNEFANRDDYLVFDDVKKNAVLDRGDFTYSRHYPDVVMAMKEGLKSIVISDISFCDYEKFMQAYKIMLWWIQSYNLDYRVRAIIFKNEPEKCISNIRRDRRRHNNQQRITMVKELSPKFDPEKMRISERDVFVDVYSQ